MKVAVYIRFANKPTTDTEHEERLLDYACKNSLEVVKIIKEYGSGRNLYRQGLTQILDVPTNEYQGVLTENISRIGRDMGKTLEWMDMLKKSGKQLFFADDSHRKMDEGHNLLQNQMF